jgi:hypothetical protein
MACASACLSGLAARRPLVFFVSCVLLCAALLGAPAALFPHPLLPPPLSLLGVDGESSEALVARLGGVRAASAAAPDEAAVSALAASLRAAAPAPLRGVHLCTVASRWFRSLDVLHESAGVFGARVDVLGAGDASFAGWGAGMGRKTLHLLHYVDALPARALVVLVDAYDVVVMRDPAEVERAYWRALARAARLEGPEDPSGARPARAASILYSAERDCMEDLRAPAHPKAAAALRYPCLNSGGIAGPAGDLARFLRAVDWAVEAGNDQRGAYRLVAAARANASLPLAAVDHWAEVFMTMHTVDWYDDIVLDARARAWRHRAFPGSQPLFFHWPSYFKRMSAGVRALAGDDGARARAGARAALGAGWAAGAAAAALAFAAGRALGAAGARAAKPPAHALAAAARAPCCGAGARAAGAAYQMLSNGGAAAPDAGAAAAAAGVGLAAAAAAAAPGAAAHAGVAAVLPPSLSAYWTKVRRHAARPEMP